MSPELLAERLQLAAAAVLLLTGATMAWTATNAVKRVVGIAIAGFAAMLALAVLRAPEAALIAALALVFAHVLIGAAIVVRLQEGYGGVELTDIDAADEHAEPPEQAA